MKLKSLGIAIGLALGLANSASALNMYQNSLFEDDNLDRVVLDINGNGLLDVGDRLRSVVEIVKITDVNGFYPSIVLSGGGQPELTGISEIELIAKIPTGFGGFFMTFGPSAAFTATYGAGAMVAFFVDPSNNLDVATCGSAANCEAKAIDGAHWATFGFGDADDQWFSIGSDNFAGAKSVGGASKVATFNYALSILVNNTGKIVNEQGVPCIIGFACAGDGKTDMVGSGDVLGGVGLHPDWDARSDFDYGLSVVPEPTTLALLGIGLLGAGMMGRRRKQ